ncbi:MAG: branched-chain amino acid aminotransferase [Amylibacter sp.]|jgi:branched-chain amino acid aminotransferase|nr:branched-chain amino acid aminotransferase [Amylibacter sp.]
MAMSDTQVTYFDGEWADGNTRILGAADHSMWHGNMVFDGARLFEGVTPDLAHHCERVIKSAETMGMASPVTASEIEGLVRDGIKRLGTEHALYLRPMMWSVDCLPGIMEADPATTQFAICLEQIAMPETGDMPMTVSPFRRPDPRSALTTAKAACLYPNNARIITEAKTRGFKNALSLDLEDNVAESATSNVFLVRDGVVRTPVHNNTFLNGVTRRRMIGLLRKDGYEVEEVSLQVEDFRDADEIFLTGNAAKVLPVTALDERNFNYGAVTKRARELYWDFAHTNYERIEL